MMLQSVAEVIIILSIPNCKQNFTGETNERLFNYPRRIFRNRIYD